MDNEGPPLEVLTRRLAETPPEFLEEPLVGGGGTVDVAAVVADLLRDLGGALPAEQVAHFRPATAAKAQKRWLRAVLVSSWLLHDPWFRARGADAGQVLGFLRETVAALARLAPPGSLVTDADRREELVRLGLKDLGYRPQGETPAQASDRLQTLSSVERQRVLAETRAAEERARQVREAMEQARAQEAAAQYAES